MTPRDRYSWVKWVWSMARSSAQALELVALIPVLGSPLVAAGSDDLSSYSTGVEREGRFTLLAEYRDKESKHIR